MPRCLRSSSSLFFRAGTSFLESLLSISVFSVYYIYPKCQACFPFQHKKNPPAKTANRFLKRFWVCGGLPHHAEEVHLAGLGQFAQGAHVPQLIQNGLCHA